MRLPRSWSPHKIARPYWAYLTGRSTYRPKTLKIGYNPRVKDCLFCRIVRREIPADVVYEDETLLAFRDIHPQAPIHALIIPKAHVARVMDVASADLPLGGAALRAAQQLAAKFSVEEKGFRLVVNNGPDAGQAVDHLHYHFLAGRRLGWPPG